MPAVDTTAGRSVPPPPNAHPTLALVAALVCLVWYIIVALVGTIGTTQIWRHYSAPNHEPTSDTSDNFNSGPEITVIRPIKGLEPFLYECLASTFRQEYPSNKLHVRFCISDRHDPAYPVLERLLRDFPQFDAQILVEEEDEVLWDGSLDLGPNPKVRNMSRAYREAIREPGGLVWIIDCNVWVSKLACPSLRTALDGYKFAHQLPLVVDTEGTTPSEETGGSFSASADAQIRTSSASEQNAGQLRHQDRSPMSIGGGRLEELFMSSSHAKFYTAINTVSIAPCIVGKSTMFRLAHLDELTHGQGINYFSRNICEDHLIGDLLWNGKVREERQGAKLGKHSICLGELAVQPMSNMSVREYWNRRVRWLRVRKFTVTLATLVEPGTESFLCSLYGAFAVTTLPIFQDTLGVPPTWSAFATFWLLSVSLWCLLDRTLYKKLHSGDSVPVDDRTPVFARPAEHGKRRPFGEWLFAWLGRESLAWPIWAWAFYGGTRVEWRGKAFKVGMDTKVHEIRDGEGSEDEEPMLRSGKARRE